MKSLLSALTLLFAANVFAQKCSPPPNDEYAVKEWQATLRIWSVIGESLFGVAPYRISDTNDPSDDSLVFDYSRLTVSNSASSFWRYLHDFAITNQYQKLQLPNLGTVLDCGTPSQALCTLNKSNVAFPLNDFWTPVYKLDFQIEIFNELGEQWRDHTFSLNPGAFSKHKVYLIWGNDLHDANKLNVTEIDLQVIERSANLLVNAAGGLLRAKYGSNTVLYPTTQICTDGTVNLFGGQAFKSNKQFGALRVINKSLDAGYEFQPDGFPPHVRQTVGVDVAFLGDFETKISQFIPLKPHERGMEYSEVCQFNSAMVGKKLYDCDEHHNLPKMFESIYRSLNFPDVQLLFLNLLQIQNVIRATGFRPPLNTHHSAPQKRMSRDHSVHSVK
jgi:hypothetical protein